jgi:hypothetical protein
MEVEYYLTFDDMLAFERHALKQVRKIAPAKMRGPWTLLRYTIAGGEAAFSPRPGTRGRGVGGEGAAAFRPATVYVMVGVIAAFIAASYHGLVGPPDALFPFL